MKVVRFLVLALFLLGCASLSPSDLARKHVHVRTVGKKVVKIEVLGMQVTLPGEPEPSNSSGSAVAVKKLGNKVLLLTCAHLFADVEVESIRLSSMQDGAIKHVSAQVLHTDPELDLALLVADDIGFSITPLSLHTLQYGDPLWTVGSPVYFADPDNKHLAFGPSVTHGMVSTTAGPCMASNSMPLNLKLKQCVLANMFIRPGNSGGPVFNASGELIGIANAIVNGFTMIIPSHLILAFSKKYDVNLFT